MSTALDQLLNNPSGLTERQVNELRAMVTEAKRVLDDRALQQRYVEEVHAEHEVIFETADGLKTSAYYPVTRTGYGLVQKIRRALPRPFFAENFDPAPVAVEAPYREYQFALWVTGGSGKRIPVYKEVLR